MRRIAQTVSMLSLLSLLAMSARAQSDDQIGAIIRRMKEQEEQFRPAELSPLDAHGIERVFDRLMALTADQVGDKRYSLGPFVVGPWSNYAPGFVQYARRVDNVDQQAALARAAARGYSAGVPFGDRGTLLNEAVLAAVRSLDDAVIDELKPLLAHENERVALTFVRQIGQARVDHPRYFPNVYLTALASRRERIVEEVIEQAPNCRDPKKALQLRAALQEIFKGDNESLKFQACFPLMHDFQDAAAIGYLIEQTRSTDASRVETAIRWLGDACNSSNTASPEILAALSAHLNSVNPQLHRGAAYALATYRGKAVLEILIDLLVDADDEVVWTAQLALLRRASPKHPERALLEAIAKDRVLNPGDETLRAECQRLLTELDSPRPSVW